MTTRIKKTIRKNANTRYLCPACHEPAIQSSTLKMVDFICPKAGELVTAYAMQNAFKLENPYE